MEHGRQCAGGSRRARRRKALQCRARCRGRTNQAAAVADRGEYDEQYRKWRDGRDYGLKASEVLLKEADRAISRAGNDYSHQMSNLKVLSELYQLPDQLDHKKNSRTCGRSWRSKS